MNPVEIALAVFGAYCGIFLASSAATAGYVWTCRLMAWRPISLETNVIDNRTMSEDGE